MSLLAALLIASAPPPAVLTGRVLADDGRPVAQAQVMVPERQRTAETDEQGRFRLTGLAGGAVTVRVTRIGYLPATQGVRLTPGDSLDLTVTLVASPLDLPAVTVTATARAADPLTTPQAVSVLEGDALREQARPSLGESLERLPGVASLGMGTAIGKPVIRGLTNDRVLVVEHGMRVQSQEWGLDHAPNVEPLDAARIEVLKGPASLLYGSDALGGVVHLVPAPLPWAAPGERLLRGRTMASLESNQRSPEGSLLLEGAHGGLGWRLSATGRAGGDMRTPGGVLRNSGFGVGDLRGAVGVRGDWGDVRLSGVQRTERLEILEDPAEAPDYTGVQRVQSTRIRLDGTVQAGGGRVEWNLGLQRNVRREFDAVEAGDPVLGLRADAVIASALFHHAPVGPLQGTIGVWSMAARSRTAGTDAFVPSSDTRDLAVFALERLQFGRLTLAGGARVDHRRLTVPGDAGRELAAESRTFGAASGSLGATLEVAPGLVLVSSGSRGFRAPSTSDLFANGFHEGTRAFERGLPTAGVETSLGVEAGVRVRTRRVEAEVLAYRNAIDGYLYLRPFGAVGGVFDSLEVVQGDARIAGVEGSITWWPRDWLRLEAGADALRGTNVAIDTPLPWMPPARARWGARLEPVRAAALGTPYLELRGEHWATQGRPDPRDVVPPGYGLLHLGAGASLGSGPRAPRVDMALRNVLDVRYRPFLSRYKEFADGLGRTLMVRVSRAW